MNIEEKIERYKSSHSAISLNDFIKVAKYFGFVLDNISGSHHIFRNWTGKKFSIPVHNKKIKAFYARKFIKEQQ